MPIAIVNLKTDNAPDVIRCDRSSVLGNPFHMRKESDRSAVIEAFKRYLWLILSHNAEPVAAAEKVAAEMGLEISPSWGKTRLSEFSKSFYSMADDAIVKAIKLGCWCAPKACHCEVLANAAVHYVPF